MSQNEPLIPINATVTESAHLSPAVSAIMERTNTWTTGVIEFESDQTNLIHYYGLKLKWAVEWIFGKPVDAKKLSDTVIAIQKLRLKEVASKEAANDAVYTEEKKAA